MFFIDNSDIQVHFDRFMNSVSDADGLAVLKEKSMGS
jgi:hypothetical protein